MELKEKMARKENAANATIKELTEKLETIDAEINEEKEKKWVTIFFLLIINFLLPILHRILFHVDNIKCGTKRIYVYFKLILARVTLRFLSLSLSVSSSLIGDNAVKTIKYIVSVLNSILN